jgi:hypothetical protein
MTVDDDIDYLARKVSQHVFSSALRLYPRIALNVEELRKNLEVETRLFDGSESETTVPAETPCDLIKPRDVQDNSDSSIMLYAGLRQCGGLAQKNRGRVPYDHWSKKDEELMKPNREALRVAFLAGETVPEVQPEKMEELEEETSQT